MTELKSLLNVPVPRRQFLKTSSAAAVGFAAAGLFRPGSVFLRALLTSFFGCVIDDLGMN